MVDESSPRKISSDRSFGLVMAGACVVLGFLLPIFHRRPIHPFLIGLGCAFAILAISHPSSLHLLNLVWLKFGYLLQKITTPIFMTILFFGIMTPYAVLIRRFSKKKSSLNLVLDPEARTYWIERDVRPGSMTQQF